MLFYISALVLGIIAGVFIAVIVSSCQRNRADELYNRLQKGGNLDNSLKHNAVNVNSVLDKDNLWGDEDQNDDDAESSVNETSNPVSFKRANKGKKVYVAGPVVRVCSTPLSSMEKHLKALLSLRSRSIRSILW